MKIEELENGIIEILTQNPDLEAKGILDELGRGMTYETLSAHLKRMTNEHKLVRVAKGKPWNYYYSLAGAKKRDPQQKIC